MSAAAGEPTRSRRTEKLFRTGTHRILTPKETLARIRPVADAIGITRSANITGLDVVGVPVWTAARPNSRSLAVSQGKGLDDDAAQVSALMESIEAFHAEHVTLPIKLASRAELAANHEVIDVEELPRTSLPWDDRAPLLWIEARDLRSARGVWVPLETVHLNHTVPPLPGSGYFLATSNGLASGNDMFEALSHAICEVIERDAATLWACAGVEGRERTRVDLASIDDPSSRALIARLDEAGVALAVWDATSDVQIASFVCWIIDRVRDPLRPLPVARGLGCHPAREIALLRAITEAVQSRLTVISGSRDDLGETRANYEHDPDAHERLRREVCTSTGARAFRTAPERSTADIEQDVAEEVAALESAGLDRILTVDLTRPELAVPVVRVLVPGLEALFDIPGYVAGRRARSTRGRKASS